MSDHKEAYLTGTVRRIPCCHCEWGWREVLYLFQMEVHLLRLYGKVCHIESRARRVAAYEVWNNLLLDSCLSASLVEDTLELSELTERRFAHKFEYFVACVLGCDFQSSANMFRDEFSGVFFVCIVQTVVLPVV